VLTHVDLFSGIGGFALAAEWAGFETVVFCEIDEFCQEILKARFGARIITNPKNTRRLREEQLENGCQGKRGRGTDDSFQKDSGFGAIANTEGREAKPTKSSGLHSKFGLPNRIPLIPDIRDFDGSRFWGTTLLTGGVPCQPASVAGKRKGTRDDRWLWPEAIRVLAEVKPTWAIFENPPGILSLEQGVVFENLLSQMESKSYKVWPIIIPACAVNAPHRRDRVWIIVHLSGERKESISQQGQRYGIKSKNYDANDTRGEKSRGVSNFKREKISEIGQTDSDASDADQKRFQGYRQSRKCARQCFIGTKDWQENWPEVATRLCRVDDGVSHRVDRLKALGNAIVPQVAYEIMRIIAMIEQIEPREEGD
jgi:DNA (cytosine-5)-methyltransferase 1